LGDTIYGVVLTCDVSGRSLSRFWRSHSSREMGQTGRDLPDRRSIQTKMLLSSRRYYGTKFGRMSQQFNIAWLTCVSSANLVVSATDMEVYR
jgi:hypothetical protein